MKRFSWPAAFTILALVFVSLTVRGLAIRAAKQSAQDHFEASDRLQKDGRVKESIDEMKLAIKNDPKFFEARLGLADLFIAQNNYSEGVKTLEEGALVDSEQRSRYYSALSDVYLQEKNYLKAIDYIKQAASISPDNKISLRQLAMLYERSGQYDLAVKTWNDFAAKFPEDDSPKRGIDRIHRLENAKPAEKKKAGKPEADVTSAEKSGTQQPQPEVFTR